MGDVGCFQCLARRRGARVAGNDGRWARPSFFCWLSFLWTVVLSIPRRRECNGGKTFHSLASLPRCCALPLFSPCPRLCLLCAPRGSASVVRPGAASKPSRLSADEAALVALMAVGAASSTSDDSSDESGEEPDVLARALPPPPPPARQPPAEVPGEEEGEECGLDEEEAAMLALMTGTGKELDEDEAGESTFALFCIHVL